MEPPPLPHRSPRMRKASLLALANAALQSAILLALPLFIGPRVAAAMEEAGAALPAATAWALSLPFPPCAIVLGALTAALVLLELTVPDKRMTFRIHLAVGIAQLLAVCAYVSLVVPAMIMAMRAVR